MISRIAFLFLLLGGAQASASDLHPIVELESGYLIGARSGSKWLSGEKVAPLMKTPTTYRLFSFTAEVGNASGSKPESVEEPCPETQTIKFAQKPESAVIAIAASWNPLPRVPRLASTTQSVYIAAVHDFLSAHGLPKAEVKITRIVRIDLDGDGEDEVLLSATNYGGDTKHPSANTPVGSYSMVLLRRVVAGKVETQMIAGEMYASKKVFNAPNAYRILSVLDCDGDGKLEVILDSSYYEGGATTIYGFRGRKMEELLSVACGA